MKKYFAFVLLSFVFSFSASVVSAEVDTSALPVKVEQAFPKLQWTGWKSITDDGKIRLIRPIVLTHAGDGSNRVFVAAQRGVIHSFANDQNAEKTEVFLDISSKVVYQDNRNEEGLLGFAFHPNFKKNGEVFVYYTTTDAPLTSVVSRFQVNKNHPDVVDPGSEEEIMRIKQPFWNHNGGTIAFGPDGYLYIVLGDGGKANDPFGNGQNLETLLGSILRIDVDHQDAGKKYAIPQDNPFVGRAKARPEIYAYGLRNIWRMSFDRETGDLWAGDVGQDLWEEINIIRKGGNYGWNIREANHKFGLNGSGPRKDLIDPIWEYHHDIGKSITGGHVYRGKRVPALVGKYIYADYVSTLIWALDYDAKAGEVRGNHPISSEKLAIMSFGEDEMGEVYFFATDGKLYRFSSN